jgi:hypothetical protein
MRTHADSTGIHLIREALEQWLAVIGRADWRRLSFYLGVPTLLVLYSATLDLHALQAEGIWPTLRFYIAHAYVPWWITCLSTRLVFILFAQVRPPAPVIWIAGALISCLLMVPYMAWIGLDISTNKFVAESPVTLSQIGLHASRVVMVWVLVNFLFERFAGLPRYRYDKPVVAGPGKLHVVEATNDSELIVIPKFLLKSGKVNEVEDLYSVSAEEHYVRIHTASGDALIYKRFSDAVKELSKLNGVRVHRSHWVSPYAVTGVTRDGKRMVVSLRDGTLIPVSRPYQEMVRGLATQCGNSGGH